MQNAIYVLNGPNLNRLGKREPEIYGRTTLAEVEAMCRKEASNRPLAFHQTKAESQKNDRNHETTEGGGAAIVINPAGWTFTSIALMDALKMFSGPIIELHISNIHRRESLYHNSLVSKVATSVIAGLGANGYRVAVASIKS